MRSDAYSVDDLWIRFNRTVSISGAAFDSTVVPGMATRLLASALNFDLGYWITNPAPDAYAKGWDFLPFPFYLFVGRDDRT